MQHCDAFDYWGKGTEVTVTSETTSSPSVFPLIPCDSVSGDKVTLGCLAHDFYPKSVTFEWTDARGTRVPSEKYISSQNNKFTGVSVISVSKSDVLSYKCSVNHPGGNKVQPVKWAFSAPNVTLLSMSSGDQRAFLCNIEEFTPKQVSVNWKKNSNSVNGFTNFGPQETGDVYSAASVLKIDKTERNQNNVYTCEVTHGGKTYTKKIAEAPVTVTLSPPSPKAMFTNRQAELKCIVTVQDADYLSKTNISWQINGHDVTDNIITESSAESKTSTLTRSLSNWENVNKVSCSAVTEDMTPVTQELTINRAGAEPNVVVHILPEENIRNGNSAEVTLVCLVSSPVLQDYYIAWSVDAGIYSDGINSPPQKTNDRYFVTSFYTTTMDMWNRKKMFNCNVWPAGSEDKMKTRGVSKAFDVSNLTHAVDCKHDATEEDELSSLSFKASTFTFLFIFSLLYNMIFSLLQVKKN